MLFQFDGVQQCLKLTEKMRGHLAVVQDMKSHLNNQQPISNNLEILKDELEQLEVSKVFFMPVTPVMSARKSPQIKRDFKYN